MKTLIIHPKDESTTFLNIVYENIEDKTVIDGNEGTTQKELRKMIPEYDRVMIMGHGSPGGLFTMGGFQGSLGYIVDYTFVEMLKENPNNVYIWCNADRFIERFKLKGFYSGMFISEEVEAYYCGVYETDEKMVDESNMRFVELVGQFSDENSSVIHENVVREYGELAKENKVALYNCRRLYLNE